MRKGIDLKLGCLYGPGSTVPKFQPIKDCYCNLSALSLVNISVEADKKCGEKVNSAYEPLHLKSGIYEMPRLAHYIINFEISKQRINIKLYCSFEMLEYNETLYSSG